MDWFNQILTDTALGVVLLGIISGLLVDYIRKKL